MSACQRRPALSLTKRTPFASSVSATLKCMSLNRFAHELWRGTYDSFTHATAHAMNAAVASTGFTIVKNPMPLARIATISECRQKRHIV